MSESDLEPGAEEAEAALTARFAALGISWRTVRHPPAHTVAEAQRVRGGLEGGHAKNLFLKSKQGAFLLACVEETRPVDVQALARALGLGRLSFASPERLMAWLQVTPGAVTPYALIHASQHPDRARLTVVIDRVLASAKTVWFHPLHNAATTGITAGDLLAFIKALGFCPHIHDFDG